MKKDFINLIKIIVLGLVLSVGVAYILAWTGPTGIATSNNIDKPINTSTSNQKKGGGTPVSLLDVSNGQILSAGNFQVLNNATFNGSLIITSVSGSGTKQLCSVLNNAIPPVYDGTIGYCP